MLQSPDGQRVAFSSESGQIYIFDLSSNSLTATYTSHAMTVRTLAWSADSQVSMKKLAVFLHIPLTVSSLATVVRFRRQKARFTRCASLTEWKTWFRSRCGTIRSLIVGSKYRHLSRRASRCFWVRVHFCPLMSILMFETKFGG